MSFIKNKLSLAVNRFKERWSGAKKLMVQLFKEPIQAIDADKNEFSVAIMAMLMSTMIITVLSFFAMFALTKGDADMEVLKSVFKSQPMIYAPLFFSFLIINYVVSLTFCVSGMEMKKGWGRIFKTTLMQLPRIHIIMVIMVFLISLTQQINFFLVLSVIYTAFEVYAAQRINFKESTFRMVATLVVNGSLFALFYIYAVPFLLRM